MQPAPNTICSLSQRLAQLAVDRSDSTAIVDVAPDGTTETITWSTLYRLTVSRAEKLRDAAAAGVDIVVVAADNSISTVVKMLSVLHAGLVLWPARPTMSAHGSVARYSQVAAKYGTVVKDDGDIYLPKLLQESASTSRGAAHCGGYILESGGTTGLPKAILFPGTIQYSRHTIPDLLEHRSGWRTGQRQLIVGPIHHAAPFTFLLHGLLDANTIILQHMFLPDQTLALIEMGVGWVFLTPTHMKGIIEFSRPERSLFNSITGVLHMSAPCDAAVKRAWLDLVGSERVFESYGATEGIGATLVRGDEWLCRPGTVGRGVGTQIRIQAEDGSRVQPGSIGEVFLRRSKRSNFTAPSVKMTVDGFSSVGDLGKVDEQGYLYLVSRRDDMFIVGGENVYPQEIETVLQKHPHVLDCAVAGVSDKLFGAAVGALVVRDTCVSLAECDIDRFLRNHLDNPKIPKIIRFVSAIPRTMLGKVDRRNLVDLLNQTPVFHEGDDRWQNF